MIFVKKRRAIRFIFSALTFTICLFSVLVFSLGISETGADGYAEKSSLIQLGGAFSYDDFSGVKEGRASVDYTSASQRKDNSLLYEVLLDGLKNTKEKIDFEKLGMRVTKDDLNTVFTSIINSKPELFYVGPSYSYYALGERVLSIVPQYSATGETLKKQKKEYEELVSTILKKVNAEWSDFEKVLFVHDYLAKNFRYDPDYLTGAGDVVYDAYHFMKTGEGVCQAYTLLAIELFNRLGINSGAVASIDMNHVWNCVELDGKWYHLDITWDDSLAQGNLDRFDDVFYDNFLCSDAAIEETGHYGWESEHVFDSRYDDLFLKKSDTHVDVTPLGSDWYILVCGKENGADGLVLSQIDFENNTYNRLAFLPAAWYTWDSSTSYYLDNYAGFGSYADTLVISTADTLYAYDMTSAEFKELGKYTYSDGYIYGMKINAGSATFRVSKHPVFSASDLYVTVNLSDIKFKVEISYENVMGTPMCDGYVAELGWGTEFSVEFPQIEGYTVKEGSISGIVPLGGISYKAIYEKHRKLTINYLYENGQKAHESYIDSSASVGKEYSIDSPAVAGYIPNTKTVVLVMGEEDVEINVIYSPTMYGIRINYVFEDGRLASEPYILSNLAYMSGYSVVSPTIKGHTADLLLIEGNITENLEITVTYSPVNCKITVEYVYSDGRVIDSVSSEISFGEAYEIVSPTIQGYSPDKAVISGVAESENLSFKVVYSVKKYTLTIKYVHTDGTQAAAPHVMKNMDYMAEYSVVSPSIENYTPTTTTVSGQITDDTEITVVYYLEKYTVKFMSEGREFYSVELNYGDIIELPNNIPVKAPSVQYYYVFLGWDGYYKDITVAGEMIFNASFEETVRSYTVVFRNYDGTILYMDEIEYGHPAEYKGEEPEHDHEEGKTCVFMGWDKDMSFISADTEFTAVFSDGMPIYTVWFYDWDGTLISTQSVVHGGNATLPKSPSRASDNTYNYVFDSWDGTYKKVKSDSKVTAKYKAVYIEYKITLKNHDGSVVEELLLHYGDSINPTKTPVREPSELYEYVFSSWSPSLPEKVTGNAEFTAQFTEKYRFDHTAEELMEAVGKIEQAKTLEERFKAISEAYKISKNVYPKDPDAAEAFETLENEMEKYNSEVAKLNEGFAKAVETTSAVGSLNIAYLAFFALLWTVLKKLLYRV